MYPEHFHLTQPPFAAEPNPEVFFPGARREETCQSLILDVLAGKRLLKLTGREGSGKTMLWRMMAERLPSEYVVLFLDNPVGAFDELVRLICLDLGMDPRGTEQDAAEAMRRLLARKQAEQSKVVLVVDEAEKLQIATLEQLLILADEDRDDLDWTMILVGRPELDQCLAQASLFHADIEVQAEYALAELTEGETRHYLRFCLDAAGMRREQFEDVFTDRAIAQIFAEARGNLRQTNSRAEETLRAACADKSFMVLLDGVEPEEPDDEPPSRWEHRVLELYELLRANRMLSGVLIGAVAAVLLIGFLLTGKGREETPPPAQPPAATATRETAPAEWRDGDKLLRERLAASASWLTGLQKGKYTIQLMMLASNQAMASIGMTLAEDDFFRIREQLFIFRNKANPPVIFVFHGLYDSLEAAREARNSMPVFLRRYHPYPLAVEDAMKKLSN